MVDVVTTILEVVAVVCIAVGAGIVAAAAVGSTFGSGIGVVVAGVVLLVAAFAADRLGRRGDV